MAKVVVPIFQNSQFSIQLLAANALGLWLEPGFVSRGAPVRRLRFYRSAQADNTHSWSLILIHAPYKGYGFMSNVFASIVAPRMSFLIDIVRLEDGIMFTGGTTGCAAKHLTRRMRQAGCQCRFTSSIQISHFRSQTRTILCLFIIRISDTEFTKNDKHKYR